VEDVGIALGGALVQALGEKPRIRRFGFAYAPLDEALSRVSLDLSGRPMAIVKAEFTSKRLGKMDVQNIEEFLQGFARGAKATLHAQVEYGRNDHHKAESMFKALGMALRQAVQVDEVRRSTPSTKGVL
jgi:imidazoleglycerol-phosphate dehydratase